MLNADQRLLVVGLYISSTLYIVGVFVGGLLTQHTWAWRLAIVTAGINYFAYLAQLSPSVSRSEHRALVIASIAVGTIAGLTLLW